MRDLSPYIPEQTDTILVTKICRPSMANDLVHVLQYHFLMKAGNGRETQSVVVYGNDGHFGSFLEFVKEWKKTELRSDDGNSVVGIKYRKP